MSSLLRELQRHRHRQRVHGAETLMTTPSSGTADADDRPVDLAAHPILFFDGVCGLCDATVNALLRRDPNAVLRFAPLQGPTAAQLLPKADANDLRSVVLLDEAGTHRRSRAIVRTLGHLGGRYRLYAWLLWVIPAPLRELGYKLVARMRYRLFGKKDQCRLPAPGEAERFLP